MNLDFKDLEIYFPYFICFDVAFKFEEIVPATSDSKDKISKFLALLAFERSFRLEHSSLQEGSSITSSMATGNIIFLGYFFLD